MVRKKSLKSPINIDPNGLYDRAQLTELFAANGEAIRSEIVKGRLRVSERLNRQWFLGSWLLEWIAGGEAAAKQRRERRQQRMAARRTSAA